ncbi:expressed unknown protein [Seminavis robusta]|uniref:Thioesterase domain-containing protein n=1 Tax=Seminavis robusta TaxID=568900 RepID=A0A9N8DNQ1_9STRA|nr:expressed unknown protein [Seminavis robusta]|eukprot:Sro180_g078680.1 n/a (250) ;mRNA; f:18606-19355
MALPSDTTKLSTRLPHDDMIANNKAQQATTDKSQNDAQHQTTLNPNLFHHAMASTLSHKPGLIEEYHLQRCTPTRQNNHLIAIGFLKVGHLLDGPSGTVHGGIVALIFDDVMGYASGALQPWSVTKDLQVEYKRPQPHKSRVVVRVYLDLDKTNNSNQPGKKKRLYLKATCRSCLGNNNDNPQSALKLHEEHEDANNTVLFSTATITMVQVLSKPPSARDAKAATVPPEPSSNHQGNTHSNSTMTRSRL